MLAYHELFNIDAHWVVIQDLYDIWQLLSVDSWMFASITYALWLFQGFDYSQDEFLVLLLVGNKIDRY
jgi:hypothetical protein